MSDVAAPLTVSAKAKSLLDVVTDRVTEWIPKNLNVWLIALTCLIVLVALSRLLSLQKSVSELQSRPSVDEHLVRQVVRQHLEETVRAMDQQNRVQLQLRQQQMLEQARKAQQALFEKQKQPPKIEIVEDSAKETPPQPAKQIADAQPEPPVTTESAPNPAPVQESTASEPQSESRPVENILVFRDDSVVVKSETVDIKADAESAPTVVPASPAPRTKRHKAKALAV